MKTFLKRIAVVFIAMLSFASVSFAQSFTGTTWQLQNPSVMSNSEMLLFTSDSTFSYLVTDLTTGKSTTERGMYEVSYNSLTLKFDDGSASFALTWLTNTKIKLSDENNYLVFAVILSADDYYMQNYTNYVINGSSSSGTYNNVSPGYNSGSSRSQTCYTCYGTGRCKICSGTGRSPGIYGQPSSPCSACGSSGKCWHCYGSGKQ